MLKAVYPGSFDPVTNGHLDIIKRASAMADTLIVGVCGNPNKQSLLTADERVELLREVTKNLENVEVMEIEGMLGEFAKEQGANVIIRGVRDISDFINEFQRAIINKQLTGDVETIFLAASPENITLSSSAVREILAFDGNLDMFVPEAVKAKLKAKNEREG
ncbi:MAG: pantetheine-phosphate adenylyltransferase [Clostridia bacterium]|nr:pantetheine-phosphate adenylyltransferase [Clostridia bacterium]